MLKLKRIKQFFMGDGEGETNLNRFMKKKQNIIGFCVLVVLIVMTVVLHSLSHKKGRHTMPSQYKKTTVVDGVLSTDFTQKNELSALEQQQQQMDRLRNELQKLQKSSASEKSNQAAHHAALLKEVKSILAARETKMKSDTTTIKTMGKASGVPFSSANQSELPNKEMPAPTHPLETIQFHYNSPTLHRVAYRSKNTLRHQARTPRTYVPAGTFAKAVLLEGADANASVNGQSDTVGILVRILDNGTLPNGHRSHLKGCFVLASIYGDISSERGEARLTKLSCTRRDGTVLEKKVQGYLSFAGKEGIKGTPVMRNGKILAMAGISGMLSGIGSALQQSTQTQSISPLGVTSTVSPSKIWQNGAYGGASTAMSQLAHYYIQRADQYHPIIEIGSGTVATVIFQSGFSLVNEEDNQNHASTGSATHTVASQNNTDEIKTLLKEAQHFSSVKSASPFSNVTE